MNEELLEAVSSIAAMYAAMLSATVAGQLGGIALSSALGVHSVLLPLVCSVVLEALAGARVGASRYGPLPPLRCARVSGTYSLGLIGFSVPLAAWLVAASPPGRLPPIAVTGALVFWFVLAAVVATALRAGLMIAFTPRGP